MGETARKNYRLNSTNQKTMKKTTIAKTLIFCVGLAIVHTTALAQPYPGSTWTIDENGPALFDTHTGIVGYSNGVLQKDPISGVTTLYYPLLGTNAPSTPGDLVLLEAPTTGQASDLLRFDGRGGVYFFSDVEAGEANTDLADVGIPPVGTNAVRVVEIGVEGNNGYLYIPLQGQPGFDVSGLLPEVQYNIISDAVPEPGSAVLLLSGGALLGLNVIRRKLRA
jgi:hypothetical protein